MKRKLLLMALFLLCIHRPYAASIGTVEDDMKENYHSSKFSHGNVRGSPAVSGGNRGTPVVSGGEGGSHSPNTQSGGGVTPLYAAAGAGAANNHRPHRGGANNDQGRTGLETLLAITTFAWFLL